MNQHLPSSHWSRLQALIKQDLAGLTDHDLAACGGSRDRLIEKFQEIYGISQEEAEGAVRYYENRLALWYSNRGSRTVN